MAIRIAVVVLIVTGIVLLGLAVYGWLTPRPEPAFAACETEVRVADAQVGRPAEVVVQLQNPTDAAVRVVGYELC